MKRLMVALAVGLALAAGAEEGDLVIDPGRGIGPITFNILEAEIRRLGAIEEHYYFYHGKAWGDTTVWPEDPLLRVKAVYSDPPDDRPAYIVINGFGSKYVLPNGLRLGSSLEEVEKANGRPFALRGMAQDDAGEVLSWCGGKLEEELPSVKLFFRPLQDLTEGLSEEQLNLVCAPITKSDAAIWKTVYVEAGKIQIARPVEPLPPGGLRYESPEEVLPTSAPPAVAGLLRDPAANDALYYPFAGGQYGFLIETPKGEESYDTHSVASLLQMNGQAECVKLREHQLETTWRPHSPLTFVAAREGGPEIDLFIADTGSFLTALHLVGEDQSAELHFLSMIRSDVSSPAYKLTLNADARPEIRQMWSFDGKEPAPGPVDYTWNGEYFCFPDGSKLKG